MTPQFQQSVVTLYNAFTRHGGGEPDDNRAMRGGPVIGTLGLRGDNGTDQPWFRVHAQGRRIPC